MTQPSPDPSGASHGDRFDPPVHIACPCQRWRPEPVALCGTPVERHVDGWRHGRPRFTIVNPGFGSWCVVCWDLARTLMIARRCERCAR